MNVVDSSGWIEFFVDGPNASAFEEPIQATAELIVPSIGLLEVFRFVLREGGESPALQVVAVMRQGRVIDLDGEIALLAGQLGLEHELPLADSVVYATARREGAEVWTQDSDLEGLPGVHFFEASG